MEWIRLGTVIFAAATLAGCATHFSGEAHIENGHAGCEAKCKEEGMELAGMVFMGEYSDACVCEVHGKGSASSRREMLVGSAGSAAGAAGVWMQEQAERERQQAAPAFPGH